MKSQIIVLDSEALSRAVSGDRHMRDLISVARSERMMIVVPASTLVEAIHSKTNISALMWVLSRVQVQPITELVARQAAELLISASRHGHSDALDAMLIAAALLAAGGGTPLIYASDPKDIRAIGGDAVATVALT